MIPNRIRFEKVTSIKQRMPHIMKLLQLVMGEREGYIVFDGFYYVNNSQYIDNDTKLSHCRFQESLPQTLEMYVDTLCYRVEFYKREILECTDDIANILKPGFHPTDIQRLYFRVKA